MDQLFNRSYSIAGLTFCLQSDVEISDSEEFLEFKESGEPDYQICFEKAEFPVGIEAPPVAKEMGFNVYRVAESFLYEYRDVNGILMHLAM